MGLITNLTLHRRNKDNQKNKFGLESKRLEGELERLKMDSGMGRELRVMWLPNPNSDRHGEVKGKVIYVYDEEVEEALETLKHEFLDHHITREVVEPLIEYVNMQKRIIEGLVYRRKERLVEGLSKLL